MKLRARDEISAEEEAAIRSSLLPRAAVPADTTIIRPGEELRHSTLLLDGIACRYKDMRDGQRQITELHVAGDFLDLHSFTLKRLDHFVMALTPCKLALMPHTKLTEITERHPHLTRVYWFGTNVDAAVHREWEVSLGRRSALSRLAHLFCELNVRLEIVGLSDGMYYDLPLTQAEVADCLGITPVHCNRVMQELRERKLLEWKGGRLSILNRDELARVGEFDPAYLYLEKRRR
ncbi:Crp/Fnr family transcriptional regulator [Sphingomonas sp. 3-13AW]|uniref:Crp/Fnr family transcriptional regulator n=1 Tax=Sphingomonas sp. 3-13AW TaxID=3050450 RepID=UPI003BB49253